MSESHVQHLSVHFCHVFPLKTSSSMTFPVPRYHHQRSATPCYAQGALLGDATGGWQGEHGGREPGECPGEQEERSLARHGFPGTWLMNPTT